MRVADLIRGATTAARPAAERKHVDLVESIESGSASVLADPERMGQVPGNLLENAIWHSPAYSVIVVSSGKSGDTWAELTVTDSRDGIPPEHLGHVFDRF